MLHLSLIKLRRSHASNLKTSVFGKFLLTIIGQMCTDQKCQCRFVEGRSYLINLIKIYDEVAWRVS